MQLYYRWAAAWVMAWVLGTGLAQAEERPQVADKILAYTGPHGVKVWTLRIGERSANQALVQVEDADHDWNMRIQKMNVEQTDRDTRYFTQVDGQKFVVLLLQEGYGELHLPGEAKPLKVGYDSNLSSYGDAQAFLNEYLKAQ
ncbi:hypothetical protein WIN67_13960 [Pseudomonas idahonensis]|uniref:hypothetical protein n=1 Tax=Pseudomonas TaxID=286 RepID=UPI000C9CBB82|nr:MULTISPECIES: hypothetical protein [Pseudomonas]MCD9568622.1 hypothetical protein [Pseudomonas protegens]MDD1018971.1 hypothetical protein [Pseudomonas idahonensis]PNG38417.1 hypothetical protein A1395_09980 [Pseudomonas protegens]